MEKIDLILEYSKETYTVSLDRRENIRKRINIIAAFGLSIVTLILVEFIGEFKFSLIKENSWLIIFLSIGAFSLLAFVVFYFIAFGVRSLSDFNLEETIYKTLDIDKTNEDIKNMYESMITFYEDEDKEKAVVMAENYVTKYYLSLIYGQKTEEVYKGNKKIFIYFILMAASIVISIISFILTKGAI